MPRLRLGVVLLLPPPLDGEVDAFRRALGDGTYGRVPAHLTLVPPVNVHRDRLADGLARLREVAAATRPLTVDLGPPATFLPTTPVLYLPVVGPGRGAVYALRDAVFQPPFARPLTWPFVPHVTLADEVAPGRILAAEEALADYGATLTVDRLFLLAETRDRSWEPVADMAFEPRRVVGRGGLELELVVTRLLDPAARAMVEREWPAQDHAVLEAGGEPPGYSVVGRRGGEVVGVVRVETGPGGARLWLHLVAGEHRGLGIGSHLLAAAESEAARRGYEAMAVGVLGGSAVETYYLQRGWREEARTAHLRTAREVVQLRRWL